MKMAKIISEGIHQASRNMAGWPVPDFEELLNTTINRPER